MAVARHGQAAAAELRFRVAGEVVVAPSAVRSRTMAVAAVAAPQEVEVEAQAEARRATQHRGAVVAAAASRC